MKLLTLASLTILLGLPFWLQTLSADSVEMESIAVGGLGIVSLTVIYLITRKQEPVTTNS